MAIMMKSITQTPADSIDAAALIIRRDTADLCHTKSEEFSAANKGHS